MRAAIVFALVLAALGGQPARAQIDQTAVAFVRGVYDREVARHAARGRIGEAEFLAVFGAATQAVWRAARDNKAKPAEPAGRILNSFFGWGVLPGHEIRLGAVAPAGRAIAVALTVRGEQRALRVIPVRESGGWRISDIAYDRGESFLAYHRRMAGR